ncbi:MAG: phospholipase/Carboxylesterase [Ferruginibacter sp.]|nr:phospholipase/Carboxylesterase [Ferruginibacter sp.]
MKRKMMIAAIISGTIIAALGICYLYFIYAPTPKEPQLSSSIMHAEMRCGTVDRTYLAYIPKHLPERPALIIALHGTAMDMEKMRSWTGYELDKLADKYGFIVLYPNGYKGNWNDFRKNSPTAASKENIDDVGFIQQLANFFVKSHQVDLKKLFVFGFSNGGQMAMRLAIEKPQFFSAVCVVSANLPTPATYAGPKEGATSRIMFVEGTKDPIVSYHGGKASLFGLQKIGDFMSANETAETFAKRNGITGVPEETKSPNGSSGISRSVEAKRWDKSGNTYVELFTVNGGGHEIPQPVFTFPRILGKTAHDFNSIEQAIEFFHIKYSR